MYCFKLSYLATFVFSPWSVGCDLIRSALMFVSCYEFELLTCWACCNCVNLLQASFIFDISIYCSFWMTLLTFSQFSLFLPVSLLCAYWIISSFSTSPLFVNIFASNIPDHSYIALLVLRFYNVSVHMLIAEHFPIKCPHLPCLLPCLALCPHRIICTPAPQPKYPYFTVQTFTGISQKRSPFRNIPETLCVIWILLLTLLQTSPTLSSALTQKNRQNFSVVMRILPVPLVIVIQTALWILCINTLIPRKTRAVTIEGSLLATLGHCMITI